MEQAMVQFEKECFKCKKLYTIRVPKQNYVQWRDHGILIQRAFPKLSVDLRELLISGICGKCYDDMFKD